MILKRKNKLAFLCGLSLLVSSLSPMGVMAADVELAEDVAVVEEAAEEASEVVVAAESEAVEAVEAAEDELSEEADVVLTGAEEVSNEAQTPKTVSPDKTPSKNEADDKDDKDKETPSDNEAKAVVDAGIYLKQVAASNDKSNSLQPVLTKGSASDTGYVVQYYTKGKVKKLGVSEDSTLSSCEVTVNAKAKLYLNGQYEVVTGSLEGENGFKLPANPKYPNAKFKNGETAVTLKVIKGAHRYKVTFEDKTQKKKITVHVVNLAFDKTIKKVGLFSREVSGNDISGNKVSGRDTLVIRPTLPGNFKNAADLLNGVWIIDKEPIQQIGEKNAVTSAKNGVKCYVDEKTGYLIVTAPQKKGNAKITYMLNGKKFTTAVKAGGTDPKPNLQVMRKSYEEAKLLYVTPEKKTDKK